MTIDWSYRPQSGGPPQAVSIHLSKLLCEQAGIKDTVAAVVEMNMCVSVKAHLPSITKYEIVLMRSLLFPRRLFFGFWTIDQRKQVI